MWWSRWVRDMARDWLALAPASGSPRILDLGCGTGALSAELKGLGVVTSLDYMPNALPFCRQRGLKRLVRGDGQRLPFRDDAFDVVVALDTIEHIPDDRAALGEVRRVLRAGGLAIINVPALQLLWSHHDVINQHHRRYSRAQLRALLEDAGLHIEKLTYTNMILFLPTLAVRLAQRLMPAPADAGAEIHEPSNLVNQLLYSVISAERHLVRHSDLPVGTSVFAVAKA